jgi:chromate reductase
MLGQPEAFIHVKNGIFDEASNIGAESKQFLQSWINKYILWVKKHVDKS